MNCDTRKWYVKFRTFEKQAPGLSVKSTVKILTVGEDLSIARLDLLAVNIFIMLKVTLYIIEHRSFSYCYSCFTESFKPASQCFSWKKNKC